MVIEEINVLKKELENQITENVSYDKLYETSVKIDTLLIEYYKNKDMLKDNFKENLNY
ncbi:MAG: Spo0E family sporulation regulatory protein-aspartic acid phosphatase [Bacilli bacterium]|nr:Spo0E family sporulation regulatory protein-aspartic acid phosphatase [Bacilli bacterium]